MGYVTSVTPGSGSLFVNNPRPVGTMVAVADTGRQYEYFWTEIHCSKTNNTAATLTFGQPGTITWHTSGIMVPLGEVVTINMPYASGGPANAPSLKPGAYYCRYQLNSKPDNFSNYIPVEQSGIYTFNVVLSPSVTPTAPVGGAFREASGQIVFSWNYNTSDPLDYMTAYQIEIRSGTVAANATPNTSNTTLVSDTGKVLVAPSSGTAKSAVVPVANNISTQMLWWRIRVWDYNDTGSSWSAIQSWDLIARPSISITSPTQNQVLNTGSPTFSFTPTVAENGTTKKVETVITQGGEEVWRKNTTISVASGTTINISDATLALKNSTTYSLQATLTDSRDMVSTTTSRNFSTSFVLPPTPSGNVVVNTAPADTSGYVDVTWDGSVRDAEFLAWQVERRDYMVNPDTGLEVSNSDWTVIGRSYTTAAEASFRDYLAPMNHTPQYRIKQIAFRFGTELVSTTGIVSKGTWIKNLAYWLVGGNNGVSTDVTAIKLYNVTADDFADEEEQAEFNLMGRGRYVEHGDQLGVRGQLTLKLRTSDGLMARQKKQALESFKSAYVTAYLKNPYGDVYQVSLGNMNISRLAGVGPSEFVDVTIPYSEVVS